MNDRLLSLLGISRRAGKLIIGCDPVRDSVAKGEAKLVVMARDISENTKKKVLSSCTESSVPCVTLLKSKEELSLALGKPCATAATIDEGFATSLRTLALSEREKEETR